MDELITLDVIADELKQLKPKRFYPSKKVHCPQGQFEKLLAEASTRVNEQSNYHVLLNSATIATMLLDFEEDSLIVQLTG